MPFRTAREFRDQARLCWELARTEPDLMLAFKLRRLAAVLRARSTEVAKDTLIVSTNIPSQNHDLTQSRRSDVRSASRNR
jgi:hypothetical protein